ncbi:YbaB/EbfC family nucleoid-associated protein [Acetobacteraceae bacterium]|nr:YbaB/EbfC family nucleoid-associated protein [Acetobacteraceae bacterium]
MKNLAGLMKQAGQMQARMKEAQEKLKGMEVSADAGAGLVSLTLTGKMEIKNLKIDPKLADPEDMETLQDLVVEAYEAARSKVQTASAEEMKKVTGGMPLPPGMGDMPFGM